MDLKKSPSEIVKITFQYRELQQNWIVIKLVLFSLDCSAKLYNSYNDLI